MSKFKSVSVRDTTFDAINKLSNELLPKVQLSKAQTIDRITAIAKSTINKSNKFPYDNEEMKQLLKEIKAYRDEMVARNYPHQQISDIITKWEIKDVKTTSEQLQDELEPIINPMSDE